MAELADEEGELFIDNTLENADIRHPARIFERWSDYVKRQSLKKKIIGVVVFTVLGAGAIVFLVFHSQILKMIDMLCEQLSDMRGGYLLFMLLLTATSFPPIVGYTAVVTISGIVFGFWKGFFLSSFATCFSSLACFITFRKFFAQFAKRLAEHNRTFGSFASTLQHDGLTLLWMIRMSPLPFSLSNGALSTVPTITPRNFFLATLLSCPKLMIHCFIGSRFRSLTDDELDTTSKIINYCSILAGISFGVASGYIIYNRMSRRAMQVRSRFE
ncbi:hypothetical protein V1511DRAFT_447765, partial [Dipodascopsis uninucleata]